MPAKPKLTENDQFRIEHILRLWEGKLSWKLLTQKIEFELGITISRQTLETYEGIYATYKLKKELIRATKVNFENKVTLNNSELLKRIKKLEASIVIKDKIINEQKRFLQRILQNASEIPFLKGNLESLIAERPEDVM